MSEHELWNELGNLYFISAMYDQAAYAYNRSIQIEQRFGMPYSNLAFTYVQQGRFEEAADLFQKSIELLTCERDKAISWYRLGDVYRHLKNYRDAIMAYQQADLLFPDVGNLIEGDLAFLYGPADAAEAQLPPVPQAKFDGVAGGSLVPDPVRSEIVETDAAIPIVAIEIEEEKGEAQASDTSSPDPTQLMPDLSEDELESANFLFEGEESSETVSEVLMHDAPDVSAAIEDFEIPEDPLFLDEEAEEYWEGIPDSMDADEIASLADLPPAPPIPAGDLRLEARARETHHTAVDVITRTPLFILPQEERANTFDPPLVSERSEAGVAGSPTGLPAQTPMEEDPPSVENEIARLERVIKSTPRSGSRWEALGSLYKSVGRYKDAIFAYQQAVTLDPNSADYHHSLGVVYAVEGRHEDAIHCLKQVIELKPDHSLSHATLGGYLRKMGLEELANHHIGIAVKNFIDDGNEYNRACLEALCGNVEEAVSHLRVALETRQTLVEWILRDPDLDNIRFTPQFKQLIADYIS